MSSITRLFTVGAVAGAVALSGVVIANAATAAPAGSAVTAVTAADDTPPPPAVEDYAYPGADQIFKDRGIKLTRGDGHIVLVACGTPGLMEVNARGMQDIDKVGGGRFCFKTTGTTGFLSLELPSVYGVSTNDYAAHLTMAAGVDSKTYDLPKNAWTGVGEIGDPQHRPFTLLEITTTK